MTISYQWLKEYLKCEHAAEELSAVLTSIGLEVEELRHLEAVPGGLKEVVVGEVLERDKHPDADKLSVCKVNVGTEILQIVCGAPNVAAGQKVLVALVGATLHFSSGEVIKIKKAKIRGVESIGMICAEDELGLGTGHDGIMVLSPDAMVGTPASEYLGLQSDVLFEIGLTPNRGDAFSHLGVARDLHAALNAAKPGSAELIWTNLDEFQEGQASAPRVDLIAGEACKRYSGIFLDNVKVQESPAWLQARLRAIGLKPLNNIVDITNFVLHECGQPLHAFDADKVKGEKISVKFLPKDTSFITLDGNSIKLHEDDLMICDEAGGMCIAGVYGGKESGVSVATTSIFLESACFDATYVRKTGFRHNLRTDAAMHFEKGTDPNGTLEALKRAASLMTEIAGANISSKMVDVYPQPVAPIRVLMNYGRIDRLIGKSIPTQTILDILSGLGFGLDEVNETGFVAVVPTIKTEVTREADVVEEILRIYGLNNVEIPSSLRASISYKEKVTRDEMEDAIAQLLIPNGFQEIMTNTISQSSFYEKESEEVQSALVKLLNSQTAELDIMRREMYYSGLESIAYNLNRKNQYIRFFETGKVYHKMEGKYIQEDRTVLYMCGPEHEASWYAAGKKSDFYQIKAFVEMLLKDNYLTHTKIDFLQQAPFEYGLSYWRGRELLVKFGKLKKSLCKQFDIKEEVYYAEFSFDQLWKARTQRKILYSPVAKFPTVRRDLALVLAESVSFEQLQQIAVRELKHHLKELSLFDIYRGDKVAEGQKSYAMSFLLGDDQKTLTDQEIDQFMNKLLVAYGTDLNASLRQ